MKKLAIVLGTVLVLCVSCLTPEAKEAHDAFVAAYQEANADGVVTQAEAAHLQDLFSAYVAHAGAGADQFDWSTLLWSLGTIVTGGAALRVLPNSAILGKQAASRLEK